MNQEQLQLHESIENAIKAVNQMIDDIHIYLQKKESDEQNENLISFVKKTEESNMKIAQITSEWHSLIVTNPALFN